MVTRGRVVLALGAGAFAPLSSFAQQPPAKVFRIGFLGSGTAAGYISRGTLAALHSGLAPMNRDGASDAEYNWRDELRAYPAILVCYGMEKPKMTMSVVMCRITLVIVLLFSAGAGQIACAQKVDNWPNRPIRMIVPFPPGGGTDLVGRSVGAKLSEALGQRVVIDNRGGAGGNIGAELAVRAEPDGYTMLIGSIGAIAINPTLYAGKLPFNPQHDLAPVTLSSDALNILMVHPSLPVKSVRELIDLARAKPDQLSFSSSGLGATDHLAGELFNRMAGVRTIHVPYKGGGPAAIDLVAGNVQFSFNTASAQVALWKAGKLRPIAVLSPKRQPLFPELPAVSETIPGYGVNNWYGIFVPAKTPAPIVRTLNAEINKILKMPDIITLHNSGGIIPVGSTPEAFAKFIAAETEKWRKVIGEAGIKVE